MMNRILSLDQLNRKIIAYTLATLAMVFVLVSAQDWIHSQVKGYNFYLSESLLFNTYWLCFIPIAFFAQKLEGRTSYWKMATLVLVSAAFHLLLYPFLVFVLSSLLFDYTYTFNKVLSYGLSKYVYITVFGYALLYIALTYRQSTKQAPMQAVEAVNSIDTIALRKGTQQLIVSTADIICIQSESPYIKISTSTDSFLHLESLKSIQEKLDKSIFIRVHKSTIINLDKVVSFKSRLNGDYDITMGNETLVRLSRNFATEFKKRFT